MQCRFCPDIDSLPMISPCKCRGSGQYIHLSCLRKWVIQGGQIHSERLLCSVCKSPFVSLFDNLESIYPKGGVAQFLLYNPLWIALFTHYCFLVYNIHDINRPFDRFKNAQIFINLVYFWLYLIYVRVKNIRLYSSLAMERRSYIYILTHAAFLWCFFIDENVVMAIASNANLTVYWYEHNSLLHAVNTFLLQN